MPERCLVAESWVVVAVCQRFFSPNPLPLYKLVGVSCRDTNGLILGLFYQTVHPAAQRTYTLYQLNDWRNSSGDRAVLFLNSLLNDCECSNPKVKAISLTDKSVVDSFSLAFSISLL